MNLICRIENLLLDTCTYCDQKYATTIDDPSLLPCEKCGQEPHLQCLAAMLDSPLGGLTKESVAQLLNPYNIKGWTYVCPDCRIDLIPSRDLDVKKSVLKSESTRVPTSPPTPATSSSVDASASSEEVPLLEETSSSPEEISASSEDLHDETSTSTEVTLLAQRDALTSTDSTQPIAPISSNTNVNPTPVQPINTTTVTEDQTNQLPSSNQGRSSGSQSDQESIAPVQEHRSRTTPQESSQTIEYYPTTPISSRVCRAYLKFKCQKSGRRCRYEHPRICTNLLDNGIKEPQGCNGRGCSNFHPPMCQSSLLLKKCEDLDCPLFHIKGTSRGTKYKETNSSDKSTSAESSNQTHA